MDLDEVNEDKLDSKEVKFELDEVSESRNFIKDLKRRRVKFIGHLLRHEFVTDIIEGKVLRQERTRKGEEIIS